MTKDLEIIELGDPLLRQKAKAVENIFDSEIQNLIDQMLISVEKAHGVGLAAPQVGVPLQIFIVSPSPTQRYPNTTVEETLVVINPSITQLSNKKDLDWEGCLSIPGLRGKVSRHKSINVNYTNRLGETHSADYHDFVARIFQHEYDHLQGTLFLDRMDSLDSLVTEKYYIDSLEEEE